MNRYLLRSAAAGLAVALAVLCALVLVCAFIAGKSSDPAKLITPMSYAILALSAFAGGAAASRIGGYDGLAASAVCGALLSVLHLAVRLALGGGDKLFPLAALYAGIVLFAFLGGSLLRKRGRKSSKSIRKLRKLSKMS